MNAVCRLSCGHDVTVREVREVPLVAWCRDCEAAHSVDASVTNEPEKRDDGHIW